MPAPSSPRPGPSHDPHRYHLPRPAGAGAAAELSGAEMSRPRTFGYIVLMGSEKLFPAELWEGRLCFGGAGTRFMTRRQANRAVEKSRLRDLISGAIWNYRVVRLVEAP